MPTGFHSWNQFQREIRHLRQLYDFTAHLYMEENKKLASQVSPVVPNRSLHTSLGTVTHNVYGLYKATASHYPERLRPLILISAVTYLETYLSSLVREISERTIKPFLISSPL